METIRIYRTNVNNQSVAETITDVIHRQLPDCSASFDLENWDKVLRVESLNGKINESKIINILNDHGYQIENLP